MGYKQYYEAREKVIEILKKDFLGPVKEDEIICDDFPTNYYILGKLYPQGTSIDETKKSSSEDVGDLEEEDCISLSNSRNPSSFGITFSVSKETEIVKVVGKAACYAEITKEEAEKRIQTPENGRKNHIYWKRQDIDIEPYEINVKELEKIRFRKFNITEGLSISVILHKKYDDGCKTITVSMINENIVADKNSTPKEECLKAVFQPQLEIFADKDTSFIDVRRNIKLNTNEELAEMELLYSDINNYASGHGCAVNWKFDENSNVQKLYTDFFPKFELLQMMPSKRFDSRILEMNYLATSEKSAIISGLYALTDEYEKWIDSIEIESNEIAEIHRKSASRNILKCRNTCETIKKSIATLEDPIVFKAFQLANKAMFSQRYQTLKNKGKISKPEDIKWYPFQIAFFLQEIISIAVPESDERKKVDLLWFPTGGGKTEAYLGIAAFVIFYRRLVYKKDSKGVTVLMRYTLRLLSFQQFERAAALICACEVIRRKEKIPGGEIGIGLWAGQALTPNKIEEADKILKGETPEYAESSNPVQIKKCPYCGSVIEESDYYCDIKNKRMLIKCPNQDCEFNEGLPVYLIDEEIYEYTPSFIVATVDKFAQLALNSNAAAIFGKHKNLLPPDLIIQDELHLISGPLGTITGLYEVAFRKLCEHNNILPKVVASTATIRNAEEQIKALYGQEFTQFPPQGINIDDSFFAEKSTKDSKPARLYLGCMAIGTSPTTMMIRVFSSMLFATRYLTEQGYPDEVVDSFWTITGYFNTLRELGGAIVRVLDDIQDRFEFLHDTKFAECYPIENCQNRYDKYKELTSREKSENIGDVIQNELTEKYKSDGSTNPYDFLLSSNMISVGVDVGRLGAMVVVGQPKTTSEYIQATSRVGRENPGLVVTTYNQSKSRDKSHYEDFTQYHESFYKFVEATSITPFSDRARDRALQALYVILCRNLITNLKEDNDAINYTTDIPELAAIRKYILDYVSIVDPDEYKHVENDIDEIEAEWERKVEASNGKLCYKGNQYTKRNERLFDEDYQEDSRFRIMNTMRSVETMVTVSTYE